MSEEKVFPEIEEEFAAFEHVMRIAEEEASEKEPEHRLKFSASLPEIQSAISVGGDGARIKLDVPEQDLAEVLKLAAFGRGKVLKMTVEVES